MWKLLVYTCCIAMVTANSRPVTNDELKDALLSIVRMFRDSTSKLERHEHRERQLGEQLKKALSGLDKRERAQDEVLENMNKVLTSIDERLSILERKIEENNAKNDNKNAYTIESLPNDSWMVNVEGLLQKYDHSQDISITRDKMLSLENSVDSKLESIASTVKQIKTQVNSLMLSTESDTNEFQNKVETQLARQESWQSSVLSVLDNQGQILSNINSQNGNNHLNGEIIDKMLEKQITVVVDFVTSKLEPKLEEVTDMLLKSNVKVISDSAEMIENSYNSIQSSYENLLQEVKALGKIEEIMLLTADNVLDTKRRIEYGVHQILFEMGDLIKYQGNELNDTINSRFDDISTKILSNQEEGLTKLSKKVETEISQVWRQVGIMYQQLTASTDTLDRLQQQTETYVNGSMQIMDSMEGKVSQITGRLSEVDENLNFLLGRLSVVAQEFGNTKNAFAKALDSIRDNFNSVQNKINEVIPEEVGGPKPIPNDSEIDNNL